MIQVSSLTAVFMVECLAGSVLILIGIVLYWMRRRTKVRNAAEHFIARLEATEAARSTQLRRRISEFCEVEPSLLRAVLDELEGCEKSLYQKIVKIFLDRNPDSLNDFEQKVQDLTVPLCKLLSQISEKTRYEPELDVGLDSSEAEIEQLKKESERLSTQLALAMETMDAISNEYSRIFGASNDAKELDNSRKRMLNIYIRAENRMTQAFLNADRKACPNEEA